MRTKQIKYSIAALVASVTVTTSCSRFEEMNINRNAVQNTTATTFVQPTVFNYEYRMINRSFTLTSATHAVYGRPPAECRQNQ